MLELEELMLTETNEGWSMGIEEEEYAEWDPDAQDVTLWSVKRENSECCS